MLLQLPSAIRTTHTITTDLSSGSDALGMLQPISLRNGAILPGPSRCVRPVNP